MVGKLLLLQGSISNLACRIDFDSTQMDLDTCSKYLKQYNNRHYVGVGALTNDTIQE
jgi:hypothetical protein